MKKNYFLLLIFLFLHVMLGTGNHLGIRKEINMSRPCEGWLRGKIEGPLGT